MIKKEKRLFMWMSHVNQSRMHSYLYDRHNRFRPLRLALQIEVVFSKSNVCFGGVIVVPGDGGLVDDRRL